RFAMGSEGNGRTAEYLDHAREAIARRVNRANANSRLIILFSFLMINTIGDGILPLAITISGNARSPHRRWCCCGGKYRSLSRDGSLGAGIRAHVRERGARVEADCAHLR